MEKKGIITVEAALIIPMFIFVMLALIIMGMLLHDFCVAKESVYITLDRAKLELKTDNTLVSSKREIQESLERKLLICDVDSIDVTDKKGKINVKVNLSNRLGQFPFVSFVDKRMTINESVFVVDECELARMTSVFIERE